MTGTRTPADVRTVTTLRSLLLAAVVTHTCVVVWHLVIVAHTNPAVLTPAFLMFVGTVVLLPFVAVVLLNTRSDQCRSRSQ